jgi:hypothetical protein
MDRPNRSKRAKYTDDEASDIDEKPTKDAQTESDRLFAAFQDSHIHLRLHGTRLPSGYTIAMRLPSRKGASKQPRKPRIKRRRMDPSKASELNRQRSALDDTDIEPDSPDEPSDGAEPVYSADVDAAVASESEDDNGQIRANNAYPGAANTIQSVHQRHWFLSLDRRYSGFRKARSGPDEGRWVGGFKSFYVRGRDYERSVVTGRLADEVMADEGVEKFVGRKMWRPILE